MKKFSPLVMFLICSYVAFAQTPEKMSYQAIVRDANNTLLEDKLQVYLLIMYYLHL